MEKNDIFTEGILQGDVLNHMTSEASVWMINVWLESRIRKRLWNKSSENQQSCIVKEHNG